MAEARIIRGLEHWQGVVRLSESLHVEKTGRLILAPGTHVQSNFEIEVSGVLQATDAAFSGEDWPGLVLKGTGPETKLMNCRFSGAQTAITVIGGAPQFSRLTLENNRIGIELRQKTAALVENSTFRKNNRVGLFLKDGTTATVKGNLFTQQGKFGAYIYRAKPAVFAGNRFTENPTGLMISHYGSDPLVFNNSFEGNSLGIMVDRSANPRVQKNVFDANVTAIKLYRRSDPLIEKNQFQRNHQAIHISFSSYPQIHYNDFISNGKALVLEFQSSTWETQKGASARQKQISGQGAFGGQKQGQVTEEQRRARNLDGTIDARQNWWGTTETHELLKLGAAANLPWIVDGKDTPFFEESGQEFPLDQVRWSPYGSHAYSSEGLP
ncbi:right-handed parallel beta-helix repeat-containing protein [Geopsychrobacter electrodiphilus]|uniref:right-handed parallel beta-helix repeat-containing protein n=1 Tax=Geopsychrobacter electrodiphilus TaxID=225196 RepID=UPI00039BA572|nr:right-handed parallel beta-helix repeat-containing protein [Geopsychrobacter electrodiphilus]